MPSIFYISLCRNPSAWCSKHHIFRFLILESGLYGIVNQYVPPDDDGDSLKVVHTTILYTLFDVYFSPWVDTSLENILCLLIFFFHLTWFFKERLWMHSTISIQSYAYYLQLGMLIKWQTLQEHFYCPIQHMFYCYLFHMVLSNWIQLQYKLKIKIWHNHCVMKVSMAKDKTRRQRWNVT